ncbi:MAG: J domain-containing protein [Deltaproteobacteria bacterium]|nr:MAG: J domain-containing protein [Deltaproteobacteria bacterium]
MNVLRLGRRIYRAARQQSSLLWEEVEREWEHISPHLRNVRDEMRDRGSRLRTQVSNEVLRWLEEELRMSMGQWRILLGQDPELETAYQTLGLPYGTELQEVKEKWRDLLKEHHPDRHMDTPQQQADATHTSQRLTAAYHRIAKAFKEHRL